jgi:hypothetical protein
MKAHSSTRRALGALMLLGCICALALPAAAGARPIIYHQIGHPALTPAYTARVIGSSYHPHGRPAAYAGAGAYTLPSGFASDTQSGARATTTTAYSLPGGFATDTQSAGRPTTTAATPSVVVREVHTVTNGPDHTLAIVLASAALGIALCGSGYAVFRTTRLQRRVVESNS